MIAFPGGTQNLAGVKKIVEHFKSDVEYWEPRKRAQLRRRARRTSSRKELKPF